MDEWNILAHLLSVARGRGGGMTMKTRTTWDTIWDFDVTSLALSKLESSKGTEMSFIFWGPCFVHRFTGVAC